MSSIGNPAVRVVSRRKIGLGYSYTLAMQDGSHENMSYTNAMKAYPELITRYDREHPKPVVKVCLDKNDATDEVESDAHDVESIVDEAAVKFSQVPVRMVGEELATGPMVTASAVDSMVNVLEGLQWKKRSVEKRKDSKTKLTVCLDPEELEELDGYLEEKLVPLGFSSALFKSACAEVDKENWSSIQDRASAVLQKLRELDFMQKWDQLRLDQTQSESDDEDEVPGKELSAADKKMEDILASFTLSQGFSASFVEAIRRKVNKKKYDRSTDLAAEWFRLLNDKEFRTKAETMEFPLHSTVSETSVNTGILTEDPTETFLTLDNAIDPKVIIMFAEKDKVEVVRTEMTGDLKFFIIDTHDEMKLRVVEHIARKYFPKPVANFEEKGKK